MNSVILQPLRRSSMDQRKESMRQLLAKHYHQHPFAFPALFIFFLVAGARNWFFMWIPVLAALSCSRGDLCECRHPDPSTVHEIMHILTPSFIIGRFLFLGLSHGGPISIDHLNHSGLYSYAYLSHIPSVWKASLLVRAL